MIADLPYIDSIEKLLTLLTDESKIIEDDTCLERILTQIDQLLVKNSTQRNERWNKIKKQCVAIVSSPAKYSHSSICFFVKLLAILVKSETAKESKLEGNIFCKVISGCNSNEKWFSPQVHSAWLWSLMHLIEAYTDEIIKDFPVSLLIKLTKSPSIFVRRDAVNFTAKFLACAAMHAQCESEEFILFFDAIKKEFEKLDLDEVAKILLVIFKKDYEAGYKIFTQTLNLSTMYQNKGSYHTMYEASHNKEIWISDFIQSIFGSTSRDTMNPFDILSSSITLDIVFKFMSCNPELVHGYHMLSAVWSCRDKLTIEDRGVCEAGLLMPLRRIGDLDIATESTKSNLSTWRATINKAILKRSVMEKLLCHLFTIINENKSVFVENGFNQLGIKLLKIILSHKESSNINAVSCLHHNWKIAKSLITTLQSTLDIKNTKLTKELLWTILGVINEVEIDYKLLSICGNMMIELLFATNEGENEHAHEINGFCNVLNKRITDMRWNMKDTAIELVTKMINKALLYESSTPEQFLNDENTQEELTRCIDDDNSYIRASVIKLISSALKCCQHFMNKAVEISMNTLLKDKEAMPRRAAVHLLNKWLVLNHEKEENILKQLEYIEINPVVEDMESDSLESSKHICVLVLHSLLWDLDWEVRKSSLIILDRWRKKIYDNKEFHGLKEKVDNIVDLLCKDFDLSVRKKAHKIFGSNEIEAVLNSELKDLLESAISYLDKDQLTSFSHHAPDHNSGIITEFNDVILDCY